MLVGRPPQDKRVPRLRPGAGGNTRPHNESSRTTISPSVPWTPLMNEPLHSACPCGSRRAFVQCCQPLLKGTESAGSPSQLMRSRYSAFATDAVDYLERTHHPSRRAADERAQLQAQAGTLQWLALEICDNSEGNAGQQTGEVEFKAFFRKGNDVRYLHERSHFIFEDEQWFYVDAVFCREQRLDIGRNDACFCGSGRKFKQCHNRH